METIDGLPKWMFRMIEKHGNTIISKKRIKRMGKEQIVKALKKHGFDCVIVESRIDDSDSTSYYGKTRSEHISEHMIIVLKERAFEYESQRVS